MAENIYLICPIRSFRNFRLVSFPNVELTPFSSFSSHHGCKQYPGFFALHSLGFLREAKSDGKRRMERTWQHIREGLLAVLQRDPGIRPGAFSESFTAEKFADVLFSLMLSALLRQDYDPATVLELVRRTVAVRS